ncbi:hypothetical protein SJAG_04691 [Schizosaccharomyces japonicus yFS275]|uniref:Uncharacterized protein n=1 Tax=Schizosaccharomyces japonicus (strain yFS275 / FY16936) TaxID=402676 RepID=B6K7H9_SCHJY|nr:hypothetical protein SJAG_04691 [Schizosaccharomyces japonicus yFS275]EEB09483.1 hypothetical protein SJAG_04691 [Schizosaccharomyces japonicus yFS275]
MSLLRSSPRLLTCGSRMFPISRLCSCPIYLASLSRLQGANSMHYFNSSANVTGRSKDTGILSVPLRLFTVSPAPAQRLFTTMSRSHRLPGISQRESGCARSAFLNVLRSFSMSHSRMTLVSTATHSAAAVSPAGESTTLIYEAPRSPRFKLLYTLTLSVAVCFFVYAVLSASNLYSSRESVHALLDSETRFFRVATFVTYLAIPLTLALSLVLLAIPRRAVYAMYSLPNNKCRLVTGLPFWHDTVLFHNVRTLPKSEITVMTALDHKSPVALKLKDKPFVFVMDSNGTFEGGRDALRQHFNVN